MFFDLPAPRLVLRLTATLPVFSTDARPLPFC